MIKHSEGPWSVAGFDKTTVLKNNVTPSIAICYDVSGANGEEAKANARLIAAAPDLLAALQLCQQLFDGDWERLNMSACEICDAARAAIEKAGGKS